MVTGGFDDHFQGFFCLSNEFETALGFRQGKAVGDKFAHGQAPARIRSMATTASYGALP